LNLPEFLPFAEKTTSALAKRGSAIDLAREDDTGSMGSSVTTWTTCQVCSKCNLIIGFPVGSLQMHGPQHFVAGFHAQALNLCHWGWLGVQETFETEIDLFSQAIDDLFEKRCVSCLPFRECCIPSIDPFSHSTRDHQLRSLLSAASVLQKVSHAAH
jgi:hypothetical protein